MLVSPGGTGDAAPYRQVQNQRPFLEQGMQGKKYLALEHGMGETGQMKTIGWGMIATGGVGELDRAEFDFHLSLLAVQPETNYFATWLHCSHL